eukprot:COSAG01_NODE_4889_length_4649_cov_6.804396_1_plen_62_part_10
MFSFQSFLTVKLKELWVGGGGGGVEKKKSEKVWRAASFTEPVQEGRGESPPYPGPPKQTGRF